MVYGWGWGKWLGCPAMGVEWTGKGAVAGGLGEPGAVREEALGREGFFMDRVIMVMRRAGVTTELKSQRRKLKKGWSGEQG